MVKIDGGSTNKNLLFMHVQTYKEYSIAHTDLNFFPYSIFLIMLLNYRCILPLTVCRIVLFKRARRIAICCFYRSGTATLASYLTHFDACLPFSSITIATKVAFAEYLTSLSS